MDWIAALKLAAGVTSALSFVAILGALYLWLASRAGERSLREIINGEDIASRAQVVHILKSFSSDKQRLEALKAILVNDEAKFRRIVTKVRARVDVGRLSLRQQAVWSIRLAIVGILLLLLALGTLMLGNRETRRTSVITHSSDQEFLAVLRQLSPAEMPTLLAFLPRQFWEHSVSRRNDLPVPDWSSFQIHESTDRFDLSEWKVFTPGMRSLVSPVLVEAELVLSKKRSADQFRVAFGTEGVALVAACTSPQSYEVQVGSVSGVPKTNLLTEVHLVIDVRRYPVGEIFRITLKGIMWNGLLPDDPWVGLVSLADGGKGKITIVAPPAKSFWNVSYFKYPDGQAEAVRAESDGTQLVRMDGHEILWEIDKLAGNTFYEVQWSFDASSP